MCLFSMLSEVKYCKKIGIEIHLCLDIHYKKKYKYLEQSLKNKLIVLNFQFDIQSIFLVRNKYFLKRGDVSDEITHLLTTCQNFQQQQKILHTTILTRYILFQQLFTKDEEICYSLRINYIQINFKYIFATSNSGNNKRH